MVGIFLLYVVDEVSVKLTIHQQHIVTLSLSCLDIRVLFVGILCI